MREDIHFFHPYLIFKILNYFRELFKKLDGTTTGPNSFKGLIGNQLSDTNLDRLKFVKFKNIESEVIDIPEEVKEDLSSDQRQLLAFIEYIATGKEASCLAWKIGKLCHSRWLTFAIRVLDLYCKTRIPSEALKTLVKFICQVYGPSWFEIKRRVYFQQGPSNLFNQMVRITKQPVKVQDVVKPVIERNAYFALPDNLLAGMLLDRDEDVRNKAVCKIIKLRERVNNEDCERDIDRQLPELNWQAAHYHEMIYWDKLTDEQQVEPATTKCMTIRELIDGIHLDPLKLQEFYCHTQCVERSVRLGMA